MRTSIAIVGGGPAGCAAALTLRRYVPDLAATLVATPVTVGGHTPAVGETLSPGVLPLFDYLGLRKDFLHLGPLPCGGTASSWGSRRLQEREYLFTGRGHGWHLDRSAFDAWLLSSAQSAGVCWIPSRALCAVRSEGLWRIELEGGEELLADILVEATGRSASLLRQEGLALRRDDGLIADARWFEHDRPETSTEGALVESVPDGWFYSASLPGRRGVAMFMTDNDLRSQTSWDDRLDAAPLTSVRLTSWQPTSAAVVRAANSQCAEVVAGGARVVAGDTAAAFDPISALGIGFSLRSGMEAARVAAAHLEDKEDAAPAASYADSVARIYADYRHRLQQIYELERRWPENPFWARRHQGGRGAGSGNAGSQESCSSALR